MRIWITHSLVLTALEIDSIYCFSHSTSSRFSIYGIWFFIILQNLIIVIVNVNYISEVKEMKALSVHAKFHAKYYKNKIYELQVLRAYFVRPNLYYIYIWSCITQSGHAISDQLVRTKCKALSYLAANYHVHSDWIKLTERGHDQYVMGYAQVQKKIAWAPRSDP